MCEIPGLWRYVSQHPLRLLSYTTKMEVQVWITQSWITGLTPSTFVYPCSFLFLLDFYSAFLSPLWAYSWINFIAFHIWRETGRNYFQQWKSMLSQWKSRLENLIYRNILTVEKIMPGVVGKTIYSSFMHLPPQSAVPYGRWCPFFKSFHWDETQPGWLEQQEREKWSVEGAPARKSSYWPSIDSDMFVGLGPSLFLVSLFKKFQ